MNKNNLNTKQKTNSDPTSNNYAKEMKNKANEKSPFGEYEPSSNTDFKRSHSKF